MNPDLDQLHADIYLGLQAHKPSAINSGPTTYCDRDAQAWPCDFIKMALTIKEWLFDSKVTLSVSAVGPPEFPLYYVARGIVDGKQVAEATGHRMWGPLDLAYESVYNYLTEQEEGAA